MSEKRSLTGLDILTTVVVLAMAAVLICRILYFAAHSLPSFDGATNLQGAWSLSEGEGYRRTYDDREPFPHSIQSNLPFTMLAALFLKAFGLGVLQAQLANIVYLLALLGVAAFIIGRRFGALSAVMSVLLLCVTPGLLDNGLDGYGEVPGLAFAMAALMVFPWQDFRQWGLRIFLAGMLLSLAYATKTVLAICTISFGLVFLACMVATSDQTAKDRRITGLVLLAAGGVLPVAATELWKLLAIGGLDGYFAWWNEGMGEITRQAGTRAGFQDTPGHLQKLLRHLQLLQDFYGLPKPLLLIWLTGPFLLSSVLFLKKPDWRRQGPLLCLLLATVVYFAWWLVLTPTLKAYHRRIFDGSLMLNLAWAYVAGEYLLQSRALSLKRRALAWMPVAFCALLSALFYRADLAPTLARDDTKANLEFERAVAVLRSLPPDAQLFGLGWYSAPALSLFADRPLRDFNDTPVMSIDWHRPVYFVLDTASLATRRQDAIRAIYRIRPLLPGAARYQIFQVNLNELNDDEAEKRPEKLATSVDFAQGPYPHTGGFQPPEVNKGGLWMTTDAFIALRYEALPRLIFTTFVLNNDQYEKPGGVRVDILVNGCRTGARKLKPGLQDVSITVPEPCRPQAGQAAVVRFLADNVARSGTIQDDRSLSVIIAKVGFAPPPATPPPPPPPPPDIAHPSVVFRAAPNPANFCDSPLVEVDVSLDVSALKLASYTVSVEAPGVARKLWIKSTTPKAVFKTGPWVRDLTKFSLADAQGKLLATSTVSAMDCSLP